MAGIGHQPGAARWALLPDELVCAILSRLTLGERHASAVRVCRQWERCCYAPELLCDLSIGSGKTWTFAHLESAATWVSRHRPTQHAWRASIDVRLEPPEYGHETLEGAALASLLSAIALGDSDGELCNLQLCVGDATLLLAGWPAALPALTSLTLDTRGRVVLGQAVRSLTNLQELDLYVLPAEVEGILLLPPSITALSWYKPYDDDDQWWFDLPEELTVLTNLQVLHLLDWGSCDGQVLQHMRALRHVQISDMTLPAALPAATSLRSLQVADTESREYEHLWEDLPKLTSLTGLTALALELVGADSLAAPQLSDALGALPQLRCLALRSRPPDCESQGTQPPEPTPTGLQPGAWAGRLSLLGLDWQVALANLQLLHAAAGLQTLWLLGDCLECTEARWRPLLDWATTPGQAPALRHISFRPNLCSTQSGPGPSAALQRSVAALRERRPGLGVSVLHKGEGRGPPAENEPPPPEEQEAPLLHDLFDLP